VDVNTASAETLSEVVDGLGSVLSERIVAYRQAHGPFTALEQLVAVQGIGPRSLQGFVDQLTLAYQAPAEGEPPRGLHEGEAVAAMEQRPHEIAAEAGELAEETPLAQPERALGDVLTVGAATSEESTETALSAPTTEATPVMEAATLQAPEEARPSARAAPEAALDKQAESEEQGPLATAEEVSQRAAHDLEAEIAEVEMEELGLYTRRNAEEALSTWTPTTRAEEMVSPEYQAQEAQGPAGAEALESIGQSPAAEELPASEPEVEASEPEGAFISEPDLAQDTLEAAPVGASERVQPELPVVESAQEVRGEEVGTMAQEAAAVSAPVGARAEKEEVREVRRGSFWRGLGLVLLGGLLGVILTLVAAIIWSGTVDFAPRQEVNALSRNLNTMQANQELAWERVDQLTIGAQELGRQVEQLQTLSGRVATMEEGLQTAQKDLTAAQSALAAMSQDVATLEKTLETSVNSLDERVTTTEDQIQTMGSTVDGLQASVDTVQERMTSFDTFFTALRDLLIDMQGGPEAISGAKAEPAPTQAP
jgi:competence ComEA-like helix-hairpin-helix protein